MSEGVYPRGRGEKGSMDVNTKGGMKGKGIGREEEKERAQEKKKMMTMTKKKRQ